MAKPRGLWPTELWDVSGDPPSAALGYAQLAAKQSYDPVVCVLGYRSASGKDSDDHDEIVSYAFPVALRIGKGVQLSRKDPAKSPVPFQESNFCSTLEYLGFLPRVVLFPPECDSGKSSALGGAATASGESRCRC